MKSLKIISEQFPLITFFLVFLQSATCSALEVEQGDGISLNSSVQYSDQTHALKKSGQNENFRFSLYSNAFPIPLNKIHSWTLHVEDNEGNAVENAEIFVFGGMPAHQHGFPTKPRITEYLGSGNYKVSGIQFSMMGNWEIRFNVKQKQLQDRIVFNVQVQ